MIKKLFLLTGLVLLLNVWGFSQDDEGGYNPVFSVVWDFYSKNNPGARVWGMGGAGVANVNDLTAMVTNPAAFDLNKRFNFYSEFTSKSDIKFLKENDYCLKSPDILPDFIGFGFKVNDRLKIGLGYSSPKYHKLDFGVIFRTDPFSPEPTDTIHLYYIFQSKQGILVVNYNFQEVVFFGANLNYNFLSYGLFENSDKVYGLDVEYLNLKFGVLAKMDQLFGFKEKDIKFDLGFVYTPKKRIETEDYYKKTTYPAQLEIGFRIYNIPLPLSFAGDIKFSQNSQAKDLEDRWDIHLGCEWVATENLAFQFGYFTRFDYRTQEGIWTGDDEDWDQHFLTTGMRFSYDRYLFQISVRDSHLLSSGFIKTTQLSLGGGVGF